MRAVIMKVRTGASLAYYVKETKRLRGVEFSCGQRITYREQKQGSQWETGVIREMIGDMPVVERW